MKNSIFILSLSFLCLGMKAQKDTIHLYYKGVFTQMTDSNEAKIENWAKKLNGKKVTVEILGYYEDSEFKKLGLERSDEIQLRVIRHARDFATIRSYGPVKGSKSQRYTADIVYWFDDAVPSSSGKGKKKKK